MKLITLKKLSLHNFGPYKGDVVLDFEGKDIIGIMAEYEEDITRSNRGGKTFCLESICYNLTGLSRAKDETKLIHHGEKEMWVTGVYTDGSKDYTIKRGRDFKKNGILELDWIQKVSEAKDEIENLFGITPDDFLLTSFFKQSDTSGFMKMKPSEKSAFLMRWLDNEHWQEKEERVKADLKVVKEKLRDNENLKKVLESSLEIDESLESIIFELKKEIKELSESKDEFNEELGVINNDIRNNNEKKEEVVTKMNRLKSEMSDIDKSLAYFEADTNDYNNYRKKYSELKTKSNSFDVSEELEVINKKLDTLKEKRSELNNTLKIAKENSSGVCPLIRQPCDRIKFDKETILSKEKELTETQNSIQKLIVKQNNHSLKESAERDMKLVQEKGARLKERLAN
jgi:DNA repair exonuclease SbcCD ATPase subunit